MIKHKVYLLLKKWGVIQHPMQKVVKQLKKRGIKLQNLDGIELFGRDGGWSTDYISKELNSIDIVEISDEFKPILEKKYPNANIYIDNTYTFIENHSKQYDIVLSDNPASKHGEYFQHFSLFPHIYKLFKNKTILILNIIPNYQFTYNPNPEEEYSALKKFYNTKKIKLNIDEMVDVYEKSANREGFTISDFYTVNRKTGVEYLCLFFERLK